MVNIKTCSLLLMMLIYHNSKSADEIDKLYRAAHNRLSEKGAEFLKSHFVPHKEPCESIAIVGGNVWKCTHKDGFAVYNCFRKCRGTIEAARLFLGLNAEKDCDPVIRVNGNLQPVCYPDQAAQFVSAHGPVIAIEIIRSCP